MVERHLVPGSWRYIAITLTIRSGVHLGFYLGETSLCRLVHRLCFFELRQRAVAVFLGNLLGGALFYSFGAAAFPEALVEALLKVLFHASARAAYQHKDYDSRRDSHGLII